MYAAFYNHCSILQFFVEEKAVDVNFARQDGVTATYFAAQQGSVDALTYLIHRGGLFLDG